MAGRHSPSLLDRRLLVQQRSTKQASYGSVQCWLLWLLAARDRLRGQTDVMN
jgi:hypothetical protein